MDSLLLPLLNGLSYGLLLFMLSAGLTLIFGMMGVLNFAHASFYMLGAYAGYALTQFAGFWLALVLAPLVVGLLGAGFERYCLRRVHAQGHVSELLVTFGLAYVILEVVQLLWGRSPVDFRPPQALQGPVFTLVHGADTGLRLVWGAATEATCGAVAPASGVVCSPFPATRGFMMVTSLVMLAALWAILRCTRVGLIIQAALTHPQMVEALGHDVPRVFMWVFGVGSALAGLAGVIGGSTFVTEPGMAAMVGSVIFVVVVVGGIGSLAGAFVASLSIGLLQTLAVGLDVSLIDAVRWLGARPAGAWLDNPVLALSLSQVAPVLPYLVLVLMLILRPHGLMGPRER